MKYIISFTFLVALLEIGCTGAAPSDKASTQQKLSELEKKGLETKLTTDTVFLGYTFRMSSYEFGEVTKKLWGEGILRKDYLDDFYFAIDDKMGSTYKGYIFANYLNGEMVSVGMTFKDDPPILVFHRLGELYEEKYGAFDIIDKPIKDMDIWDKYWIRNNLKIRLHAGLSSTYTEYIDLRFEKQKLKSDSTNKANQENDLKSKL